MRLALEFPSGRRGRKHVSVRTGVANPTGLTDLKAKSPILPLSLTEMIHKLCFPILLFYSSVDSNVGEKRILAETQHRPLKKEHLIHMILFIFAGDLGARFFLRTKLMRETV